MPKLPKHVTTRLATQKLDKGVTSTRQGLTYLEAHYVRRLMNEVFGFDGWSCETLENKVVNAQTYPKGGKTQCEVINQAKVRLTIHTPEGDFVREGTGLGNGLNYIGKEGGSVISSYELAAKEAESDAYKRAAIGFGDIFGLALYDKSQKNVTESPEATKEMRDPEKVQQIKDCATVEGLKELWGQMSASTAAIYMDDLRARKEELENG